MTTGSHPTRSDSPTSQRVFISYSSKDRGFASRLAQFLHANKIYCWIAEEDIPPGAEWEKAVGQALDKCTHMIVLLTPDSVKSREVSFEYSRFLKQNKPILPVVLATCAIPYRLGWLQWLSVIGLEDRQAMQTIAEELRKILLLESPPPPPPHVDPIEWVVDDVGANKLVVAMQQWIRIICETTRVDPEDIAITLYGHTTSQSGIGKFEYDLLYYWNVWDPTLMYGPNIKGDMRTVVSEKDALWEINADPKGNFVEREHIRNSAWFKLGKNFWNINGLQSDPNNDPASVAGLLFINMREGALVRNHIQVAKVRQALARLENTITAINKRRQERRDQRIVALHRAMNLDDAVQKLNSRLSTDVEPTDIHALLSTLVSKYEKIMGKENLAFTIFVYDQTFNNLAWLWSNGPTSTPAVYNLEKSNPREPLVIRVTKDPTHRPRLVNHLPLVQFRDMPIMTKHGSEVQANITVPILGIDSSRPNQLLGIVDIQSKTGTYFDTDDVQFAYDLVSSFIVGFMSKIERDQLAGTVAPTLRDNAILEASTPVSFLAKHNLAFDVRDLVALNFNPMKYLFHWKRIESLITKQRVEFPSLVELWPSMTCNHECIWCRTSNDRLEFTNGNSMMGEDSLVSLAEDLAKQDHVDILITGGGEPMLNPHLTKFMKILRGGTVGTVGIFTNGTRPEDFQFWEDFFALDSRHSFVRISFNGHDPNLYTTIHLPHDKKDQNRREQNYAEARKMVLDLLAMRSARCTIAMGSTVMSHWKDTIRDQIQHARRLGADFVQIRPELFESARNDDWKEIREITIKEAEVYADAKDFAVIYTDNERGYQDHEYNVCYAMHLVPAITPSKEEGWLTVWPCSYAMNRVGVVPRLGIMREGTTMSEFWQALNEARAGAANAETDDIPKLRRADIDPSRGCPQCRYYMLNQRIIALKKKCEVDPTALDTLAHFVKQLETNPAEVDDDLKNRIKALWPDASIIDPDIAQQAFVLAEKLGMRPSL